MVGKAKFKSSKKKVRKYISNEFNFQKQLTKTKMNTEQAVQVLRQATRRSATQLLKTYKQLFPKLTVIDLVKIVRAAKNTNLPSKYNTIYNWVSRTFQNIQKHQRSQARQSRVVTQAVKQIIKRKIHLKLNTSCRKVAAYLKSKGKPISKSTVNRCTKKMGLFPYKRYRQQKLTQLHKDNRVKTAKLWLQKFGKTEKNRNFIWTKTISTDFSAFIRVNMPHNIKNSIVYGISRNEVDQSRLGGVLQEKFSPGFILWGGICSKGLLPKKNPIFFSDWLLKYCLREGKVKKTLDSNGYAAFLREIVFPMIRRELGENAFDVWAWEDDTDKKHRTAIVLHLIDETFKTRISPLQQCGKMADVWPIENVWGILRSKLDGIDIQNRQQLKKFISEKWREIDSELCKKLMLSIPKRLDAVVKKQGEQVLKKDYE